MTKAKESSRPRSQWFRVYTGIMEDAKVMQLSSSHFKTWVLTLCMAKEGDGTLPSIDVIAFKLRLRVDVAKQHIEALVNAGLIDRNESHLTPHNWDKYQYASDVSTARVERFRERKKSVSGNDDETFQKPPQRTENREQNTDIPQTPNAALPLDGDFGSADSKQKRDRDPQKQQEAWFYQWYATYWKKVKPAKAKEAFLKSVRDQQTFDAIVAAMKYQAPFYASKQSQYRPHPTSWLNARQWEDDPSEYQIQPEQSSHSFAASKPGTSDLPLWTMEDYRREQAAKAAADAEYDRMHGGLFEEGAL